MIIAPWLRLTLLIMAGVIPRWQSFFTTSTDYSLRGLAMPIIDSLGIACVIIIARTRNPLVDGEPTPVTLIQEKDAKPLKTTVENPPSAPVPTHEAQPPKEALPTPGESRITPP